jgi:hypothetical protein
MDNLEGIAPEAQRQLLSVDKTAASLPPKPVSGPRSCVCDSQYLDATGVSRKTTQKENRWRR